MRLRLLWLLPWLVLAWATASQIYFLKWDKYPGIRFTDALLWQGPPWIAWALATPLILRLGERFPLARGHLARALPLHLALVLCIGLLYVTIATWGCRLIGLGYCLEQPFTTVVRVHFLKMLDVEIVTYAAVLALGRAAALKRRAQEREIAAAQLSEQLAQAQLAELKMQLRPHFLFNTLHAIGVLVRKQDGPGALRMLSGLSDLLRVLLEDDGRQLVPLHEELDLLGRYLDIERTRFQDRLQVQLDIAPDALSAHVPNLILQPLVENALRHGLAPRAEPGLLLVRAAAHGDRLRIEVVDDGVDLREGWEPGTGLRNARTRLGGLFPGRHQLRLEPLARGVRVLLEIPIVREAAPRG
jgi:two-component system, LytTR family, sensor kinase